jgi:hypothetical protein
MFDYIVCKGAFRRIEFHRVRFHFTLILSGFYNDRGGKVESNCTQGIGQTVRTSQRTTYLLM